MKNIKSSNHIVKSLDVAFSSIGKKTRSQDCNVAHHVLAESIVCRSTRQCQLLKCTSEIVPLHPKTLKKYWDNLDVEGQMETLFSGRFPRKGMNLVERVKGLVHTFWHDNTMEIEPKRYNNTLTKLLIKHAKFTPKETEIGA